VKSVSCVQRESQRMYRQIYLFLLIRGAFTSTTELDIYVVPTRLVVNDLGSSVSQKVDVEVSKVHIIGRTKVTEAVERDAEQGGERFCRRPREPSPQEKSRLSSIPQRHAGLLYRFDGNHSLTDLCRDDVCHVVDQCFATNGQHVSGPSMQDPRPTP
jgi:hypothetical protein